MLAIKFLLSAFIVLVGSSVFYCEADKSEFWQEFSRKMMIASGLLIVIFAIWAIWSF